MDKTGKFEQLKLPAPRLTSKQLEELFKESGYMERAFFPPKVPFCPSLEAGKTPGLEPLPAPKKQASGAKPREGLSK